MADDSDRIREVPRGGPGLTASRGLGARALAAIRALEQEVVAHDGGRLKLEHGVLEQRDPSLVQDLLWWEDDRLLGYAGLYAFGPPDVEIAGMVAPEARCRGLGTALLGAALPLARDRGYARALLVTPAGTPAGEAFVRAQGGVRDHAEHFLVLGQTPDGAPRDPSVTVRPSLPADSEAELALLSAGFGYEAELPRDHPGDTRYVIERAGEAVGAVRLSVHGETGGIYGFVVRPDLQGQGIGRDVLARACRMLRDGGCTRVTLEVETQNEGALGLYLSTGFVREAGEEYWALTL